MADVFIGVSLKLYFDHDTTRRWCRSVATAVSGHPALTRREAELVVLPSYPSLPAAVETFAGTGVEVGAQDLSWVERGPYTGEVSAETLRQVGCSHVVIGHAERRRYFEEEQGRLGAKVAAAARAGLVPLVCIGEARRTEAGRAADECLGQLDGIPLPPRAVVAYEPEWAIGAVAAAPPGYVRDVVTRVRAGLEAAARTVRVIYGGAAGPGTLDALGDAVDGVFLGRSAHDPAAVVRLLDEVAARPSGRTV